MNADDISDFLAKVKEAEEIGLTPAEVWRTEENTTTCWGCARDFPDREMLPRPCGEGEYCRRCAAKNAQEFDLERCARCKRETAPENGYRTSAGFFCAPCSSEYNDSSVR
jgi:hypothetical protein